MKNAVAIGMSTLCLSGVASAQSSVTLYGLIDTSVRYETNANSAGNNSFGLSEGVLTGSRWGFRGTEDLGGGTRAIFTLESGFSPTNGTSEQGGRLFGREAYIGLDDNTWGTLTLGRQYTLAQDVLSSFDAMSFANLGTVGYQFGNYTGGRYDNTVRYAKTFSGATVQGAYTFSNTPGNFNNGAAKAISATYANGPLYFGAVYQVTYDVSSAYFNAVSAAQASTQQVWGFGGSYTLGPACFYLGYTNNRLNVADYSNQAYYVGATYNFTPALRLLSTVQFDMLHHLGQPGHRLTSGLMLDNSLSKSTDIYAALDYTTLQGAWVNLNSFSDGEYGNNKTFGVSLGVRHWF